MRQLYRDEINAILRMALSLVFLYFGFSQILSPDNWTGFVPNFMTGTIITAANLVIFNGILEINLGIFLLIGLYVRFSSIILSLHLFAIMFSLGFSQIGIRDFGLAVATLVVFFNGSDKFCLDEKLKR